MDACRICGATTGTAAATATSDRGSSTWVSCSSCGVYRIDPYPTEEELRDYYAVGYREHDGFAEAGYAVSHRVRFAPEYRDVVNGEYRQSMSDLGLSVADHADAQVLDYGCADGLFLDYLRSEGMDPSRLTGVDISPEMVAVVVERGYKGHTSDAFDPAPSGRYDLIFLWDVIEHVPSPRATLELLRSVLAPDGRILIQTPRIGLLAERLNGHFEHFLPIEHLHLFPRATLTRTAAEAGLTTVRACSFGANAPAARIAQPYKSAFDALAKTTDNGATQLLLLAQE